MKWKEDDSLRQRESTKKDLEYEWREGSNKSVLDKYKITERFKRVTLDESEKELNKQRDIKRKKIEYLIHREREEIDRRILEREKDDDVDLNDLCKSINTANRPIPADYSREPRIYGGAVINEKEKTTLKLPPKFTMYEKVNKQQCLVEIETAVSKYLWTLRKECNDENEESEVSEHDRNIKSSTSCRMTDKRNNKTLNTSELSDVLKATEESMTDASYESLNDRSRLTGMTPSTTNAQSNTDKVPKNGAKDNIDSMAIRTRSQTRKLALENQIQTNNINTNPSQPVKNTPTTHANPTPTDPRPLNLNNSSQSV